MIVEVAFDVEEVFAEYAGCGTHAVRLRVKADGVDMLRAVARALTQAGHDLESLHRWTEEGSKGVK